VVVLVEGASDAAVVRVLCAAAGLDEAGDGYEVRAMGGVTNIAHHLRRLQGCTGVRRVLGLCDAPEERFVMRALAREGHPVADRDDLDRLGFVVCERDLEDELIRALGTRRVETVLLELGELERFRALQQQPQWRGRPASDQLHRFAGTRSGRKLLLARRLAEELTALSTPPPLARLVRLVEAAVQAPPGLDQVRRDDGVVSELGGLEPGPT